VAAASGESFGGVRGAIGARTAAAVGLARGGGGATGAIGAATGLAADAAFEADALVVSLLIAEGEGAFVHPAINPQRSKRGERRTEIMMIRRMCFSRER
jgi:hypothetical protein